MGEGQIVVIINNKSAYVIEKGHNNNKLEAIKIAIERHNDILKKEIEWAKENNIKDTNGEPIWINLNTDVEDIRAFDAPPSPFFGNNC